MSYTYDPALHQHLRMRHWNNVSREDMDGPTERDPAFEAVVDDLMALDPKDRQKAAMELDAARVHSYSDLGKACYQRGVSAKCRQIIASYKSGQR